MTVQDNSVPALPDRQRQMRWGYYGVRMLLVAVLVAVAALSIHPGPPDKFRYREGDIARERIVAPYDFRLEKDEPALRRQQEQAAAAVPPVFVVDSRVSAESLNRFALFQEKALALVLDPSLKP